MSISLIAVFIPILLMGGIVGRLFREFAVTLAVAIARFAGGLADHHADDVRASSCNPSANGAHGRFYRASERVFDWMLGGYETQPGLGAAASAAHAAGRRSAPSA